MKRLILLVFALSACSEKLPPEVETAGNDSALAAIEKAAVKFEKPGIISDSVTLPDYQRITLANGAVVLLHEKTDVPVISVSGVLRGGSVEDPPGKSGTASLMAMLLSRGAGQRNAEQFAEEVAYVGGDLAADAGMESVSINAQFLKRDENLMVELLGDMLMRPQFDEQEFDKLRTREVEFLKAAKDSDPRGLIGTYGRAFLFKGHPYGRPTGGDETSLMNITAEDIRRYYQDHMGGNRLVLSIAGDFNAGELLVKLQQQFGNWRPARQALTPVPALEKVTGKRVLLVDKPGATQTYFWSGNIGVSSTYPRRAALALVNTVFGGRFTSMLNTELRVKSGLTYGANCQILKLTQGGSLSIVSYTQTDTTVAAIDLAHDTLMSLHENGISDDMADSARNYILGQFPSSLETAGELAAQLVALEFYGLGKEWVNNYANEVRAVDRDAIQREIGAVYPTTDDLVMVVLGDADLIREQISKYGVVTEMSINYPGFIDE